MHLGSMLSSIYYGMESVLVREDVAFMCIEKNLNYKGKSKITFCRQRYAISVVSTTANKQFSGIYKTKDREPPEEDTSD